MHKKIVVSLSGGTLMFSIQIMPDIAGRSRQKRGGKQFVHWGIYKEKAVKQKICMQGERLPKFLWPYSGNLESDPTI